MQIKSGHLGLRQINPTGKSRLISEWCQAREIKNISVFA